VSYQASRRRALIEQAIATAIGTSTTVTGIRADAGARIASSRSRAPSVVDTADANATRHWLELVAQSDSTAARAGPAVS
jgi:hypothetical protein